MSPVSEAALASCVHSVDLLVRHCPVVVPIAPLLQYCAALNLPVLALVIAAADQEESHDLQVSGCCLSQPQEILITIHINVDRYK